MKFLLDVNIPPKLGKLLQKLGHQYRSLIEIKKITLSDIEIVEMAKRNEEIILTHDLDFGQILTFSGEPSPSVIIFRISKVNAEVFFGLLEDNLEKIEGDLLSGAIVIFKSNSIRIRRLPVK